MRQALKLVHLIGLVLFLGSIATFIVASRVPSGGDVGSLVTARRVISAGTNALTLPGLGLLIVSGVSLAWGRLRLRDHRWLQVMALAAGAIALNGILFVMPSVRSATALAEESCSRGTVLAAYTRAYRLESAAGGVNVALGLLAMIAGVVGTPRGVRRAT
jgi:heme/copper-type cytochrome/quinol oxidase subunit 3